MTPQGNQVAGNDDDVMVLMRQVIAEELAKTQGQGAPPAATVQTPAPIPVTLNGQTFNFNSHEDLSKSIQTMVDSYNQKLADVQAPVKPIQGNEEPTFTKEMFVEKMLENPLEALNYADKTRFGVANPAEAIRDAISSKQKLDELNKVISVYQFRDQHPEVGQNPQAVNVIAQIIKGQGLPETAQGLEAAYSIGVMRGMIPPPPQMIQQFQGQPQNPYNPAPSPYNGTDPRQFNGGYTFNAPPRINRGAQDPIPDINSQIEDMSMDQLLSTYNRLQGT